jgi:hypothetical protein
MHGENGWSEWRPFPDPRKLGLITAPFGPGCYELRDTRDITAEIFVLIGCSRNVAWRMASLLPKPSGCGTRNNKDKQEYVVANLPFIEYRTHACPAKPDALALERACRQIRRYRFPT